MSDVKTPNYDEILATLAWPPLAGFADEIEDDMRKLFADSMGFPGLPADIQSLLAPVSDVINRLGEESAAWAKARVKSSPTPQDAEIFIHLGRLLDALAVLEFAPLAFVPEFFRVMPDGRIAVNRIHLRRLSIDSSYPRFSEAQKCLIKPYLHEKAFRDPGDADRHASLAYSFAAFLASVLLDVMADSAAAALHKINAARLANPGIHPELPVLFDKIMAYGVSKAPSMTCQKLAESVVGLAKSNPFTLDSEPSPNVWGHEVYEYSVHGYNKKSNKQEDRVLRILDMDFGPFCLVLVADGVSTADIGTGGDAAEEIVKAFKPDRAFKIAAEQAQARPGNGWMDVMDEFLLHGLHVANEAVVAGINLGCEAEGIADPASKHTMCSTLTAVVVYKNQAIVRWLGDSPAFLCSPKRGGHLWKLTVDHHKEGESGYSVKPESDDESLTHFVGACEYDKVDRMFKSEVDDGQSIRVQLRSGDILLLCSDGAVNCPAGGPEQAVREIEALLQDDKKTLHQKVKGIIRLGEDGNSSDNISAICLRVSELGQAPAQQRQIVEQQPAQKTGILSRPAANLLQQQFVARPVDAPKIGYVGGGSIGGKAIHKAPHQS